MKKETDVIERITNLYKSFSKSQKKIADYIFSNYDKGAFITAGKLSELTGVSCSTVVRFATALGYDGYFELQSAMQDMVRSKLTSVQRMEIITSRLGDEDILNTTLNSDVVKIRKTLEDIDKQAFNTAVNLITTSSRIYIIGTRGSAFLAGFLHHHLNIILDNIVIIQSSSASDVYEQILRICDDSLLIAISFPRYSHITVKALQYARDRKAKIVAITDSYSSPLNIYADHTLIAHSDIASFADSLVAPLSVINALIAAVGVMKKDDVCKALGQLENIWDEYEVYEKNGD